MLATRRVVVVVVKGGVMWIVGVRRDLETEVSKGRERITATEVIQLEGVEDPLVGGFEALEKGGGAIRMLAQDARSSQQWIRSSCVVTAMSFSFFS